ncbi:MULTISPECIES: hypothetical protein [Pasteurellaceae]|uniref:hypothetical protein n=1 Tax=Pasteurellaceae TaxID=712 RepID=UPI002743C48B|nr:hypothetical protein [Pasteurella atlantica]MDP8039606.1 hypothetical protein [Pasteurella atlantica]MDP8045918.1 hypothetical protein [Pasteurella atlantica]
MKKYSIIFFLLVSSLTFSVFAKEPEYDGAYIKTKSGEYIELPSFEPGQNTTGYFSYICLEESGKKYPSIKKSSLRNFLLKGGYKFNYLSFHKLRIRDKSFGRYFLCFDRNSKISYRKKTRSNKAIVDIKSFDKGVIIAWINNDFWIFKIK